MGSALVCVELGVGPKFEPNKFGGVGEKQSTHEHTQAGEVGLGAGRGMDWAWHSHCDCIDFVYKYIACALLLLITDSCETESSRYK